MSAGVHTVVIVLNWNGLDDLLRCLGSLQPQLSAGVKVLVVDNGSSDGSVEAASDAFPGVEVLALERNLGYASGNNAGFRHAMQHCAPQYVVFLNNDTVVEPGSLDLLTATLDRDTRAGIVVPKIYFMDKPGRIWYAGGVVRLGIGLVRHVGIRQTDSGQYDARQATGYATGCCLAMRSCDFLRFGGFDERFGMYSEDVDLSLRVQHEGFFVVYEPSARVQHRVSASLGGGMHPQKLFRRSAAMLRLMAKHRAWSGFVCYPFVLLLQALGALPNVFARTTPES